ncbi:uncharacterized protein ACN427_011596 [Glossina fuscipes fuscipes]
MAVETSKMSGNFKSQKEYINNEFIKTCLENGFFTDEIEINDLIINKINLGGDNYCSDIYQGHVIYRLNNRNFNGEGTQRVEEIQLIIKRMPKEKQGVLQRLQIFNREKFFYTHLKIQMETLMTLVKNSWLLAPKLFYHTTNPFETFVFEDLKQLGFQLSSRQLGLNKNESLLVMEKLAEYHACSILMLNKFSDLNDIRNRYKCGLLNDISIKSDSFQLLFGGQLLKLAQLLAEDLEFSHSSKKLLNYYDQFTENVLNSVYPLEGQVNVLNHGDIWVNNLFFKYDKKLRDGNPTPTDIRFIDFQLSFCGSLGFDVNYFLNTSLQLNVLQQYRETLINYYAETLVKTLRLLPYDGSIPTIQAILDEISAKEAYGWVIAFTFFPLMSMDATDSQDNSLESLNDSVFAQRKIDLMFKSKSRTVEALKFIIKRMEQLQIL